MVEYQYYYSSTRSSSLCGAREPKVERAKKQGKQSEGKSVVADPCGDLFRLFTAAADDAVLSLAAGK